MSPPFLRRALLRAAVPALALAQLAVADAGVLAGALAAGLGHDHALSVQRDGGHLDLVLHHHEDGARPARASVALTGRDAHADDHVVHVASAEPSREGGRRIGLAPVWLPAGAPALAAAPAFALPARVAAHASSGACDLLRSVVLRV